MGCSPKRFGNAFSFIVAVFHKPKNSTWMVDLRLWIHWIQILGKMPRITRNGLDLELDWMIGFNGFIMFYVSRNSNPYYYHDGIII